MAVGGAGDANTPFSAYTYGTTVIDRFKNILNQGIDIEFQYPSRIEIYAEVIATQLPIMFRFELLIRSTSYNLIFRKEVLQLQSHLLKRRPNTRDLNSEFEPRLPRDKYRSHQIRLLETPIVLIKISTDSTIEKELPFSMWRFQKADFYVSALQLLLL